MTEQFCGYETTCLDRRIPYVASEAHAALLAVFSTKISGFGKPDLAG